MRVQDKETSLVAIGYFYNDVVVGYAELVIISPGNNLVYTIDYAYIK